VAFQGDSRLDEPMTISGRPYDPMTRFRVSAMVWFSLKFSNIDRNL
jgi:hypothetical protein